MSVGRATVRMIVTVSDEKTRLLRATRLGLSAIEPIEGPLLSEQEPRIGCYLTR